MDNIIKDANNGNVQAQVNLGVLYASGTGVKPNIKKQPAEVRIVERRGRYVRYRYSHFLMTKQQTSRHITPYTTAFIYGHIK